MFLRSPTSYVTQCENGLGTGPKELVILLEVIRALQLYNQEMPLFGVK